MKSEKSKNMKVGGLGIATSLIGSALEFFGRCSDFNPSLSIQRCGRDTQGKQNMNKIMTFGAVALCAAALQADITSSNIVG